MCAMRNSSSARTPTGTSELRWQPKCIYKKRGTQEKPHRLAALASHALPRCVLIWVSSSRSFAKFWKNSCGAAGGEERKKRKKDWADGARPTPP